MIARIWRGVTRLKDADRYYAYLLETGVRDYRAVPGNRGVHVLRRVHAGAAEFVIVTFWDSMAAIRRFAGADPEQAVYYPKDAVFLLTMETRVSHFEVLSEPTDMPTTDAARLAAPGKPCHPFAVTDGYGGDSPPSHGWIASLATLCPGQSPGFAAPR